MKKEAILKGNAYNLMSSEQYMALVTATQNNQHNLVYEVIDINEKECVLVTRKRSKKFTAPLKAVTIIPNIGEVCYLLGVGKSKVSVVKFSETFYTDHIITVVMLDGSGLVKNVKANKLQLINEKEIKETPFENGYFLDENNYVCYAKEFDKKVSISFYEHSCCIKTVDKIEFLKTKPIFLTQLGFKLCDSIIRERRGFVTNNELGLYQIFLTDKGYIKYKRFCNHPTEHFDCSSSLRTFCVEFSDYMIKK